MLALLIVRSRGAVPEEFWVFFDFGEQAHQALPLLAQLSTRRGCSLAIPRMAESVDFED